MKHTPTTVPMLNIVTVNWNNYQGRGAQYVNTLFDMVGRHISSRIEKRFVCFTNDPIGIDSQVEIRSLPERLNGWYNKLALFAPDAFPAGERVLYFDLSCVICGDLDQIAQYDRPFAILQDFYNPKRVQSAVMAWEAGIWDCIWENYLKEGKPEEPGGDQVFIERWIMGVNAGPDILQSLYQKQIVSYKTENITNKIPRGIKVICCHGNPKPHEITNPIIQNIWRVGGWASADVETHCNTQDEILHANINYSLQVVKDKVIERAYNTQEAVIIGGGPSVAGDIPLIKEYYRRGFKIFALNNVAKWLFANHGIRADYQVIMDARPQNIQFVNKCWAKVMLLASQVDPQVVSRCVAANIPVLLWHCKIPAIRSKMLIDHPENELLIGGGTTVLTRAMVLAYTMGHRTFHLFGVDSSFEDKHHAYEQKGNDTDNNSIVDIIVNSSHFRSVPWMVAQVNEFQVVASDLANLDATIVVHGRGLLPYVACQMMQEAAAA